MIYSSVFEDSSSFRNRAVIRNVHQSQDGQVWPRYTEVDETGTKDTRRAIWFFADTQRVRDRPGLDRDDFVADVLVLFDVDGPVDHLIPDGRVVGPIHHVYLDLHCPR